MNSIIQRKRECSPVNRSLSQRAMKILKHRLRRASALNEIGVPQQQANREADETTTTTDDASRGFNGGSNTTVQPETEKAEGSPLLQTIERKTKGIWRYGSRRRSSGSSANSTNGNSHNNQNQPNHRREIDDIILDNGGPGSRTARTGNTKDAYMYAMRFNGLWIRWPNRVIRYRHEDWNQGGGSDFACESEMRPILLRQPIREEKFWRQDHIDAPLCLMVYGSICIDVKAPCLQTTIGICRDVFQGRRITMDETSWKLYRQQHPVARPKRSFRKSEKVTPQTLRRDITNHARALKYLVDNVLIYREQWSEVLIQRTHKILYDGDNDARPGLYRIGDSCLPQAEGRFMRSVPVVKAKHMQQNMHHLIKSLKWEISDYIWMDRLNPYDNPYDLVARYHHQLIMLHPFEEGNERLARIVVNVLLLQVTGHPVFFGCTASDKQEHQRVVSIGRSAFFARDMSSESPIQTLQTDLATFLRAGPSRVVRVRGGSLGCGFILVPTRG